MAEEAVSVVVAAASTKKAKKSAGPKKPKTAPTHPPTSSMVNAAIRTLKERGGSSLPAIKKYLAANYNVDVEKLSPYIKKYLKSAVTAGKLIQTKGKGATGSFKLPAKAEKKTAKPKKAAVAKKAPDAAKSRQQGWIWLPEQTVAGPAKKAAPKKAAAAKKAAKPKKSPDAAKSRQQGWIWLPKQTVAGAAKKSAPKKGAKK